LEASSNAASGSEEPDTANGVAFQQLADAPTQHGTNQEAGVED
jgi:hypothetical protein